MKIICNRKPCEDSFFMPAEYDAHEGTLMIYPVRPGSWGKDRSGALESFKRIFIEIIKRENLYLLQVRNIFLKEWSKLSLPTS